MLAFDADRESSLEGEHNYFLVRRYTGPQKRAGTLFSGSSRIAGIYWEIGSRKRTHDAEQQIL